MGKLSDRQRDEMVRRYKAENVSITALAREYDISHQSLAKTLHRRGIPVRGTKQCRRLLKEEIDEFIHLYTKNSMSVPAIAERSGRSGASVTKSLRSRGIKIDLAARNRARTSDAKRNAIETLYVSGRSIAQVAEAIDRSTQLVYSELKRRGVQLRPQKRKTRFADEPETTASILKGYKNGCSIPLLAEVYKCSRDAIKQVLSEADVSLRKDGPGKKVYQYIDRKGREHWMRSSWEIKTAIYLDGKGSDWDYEKESYEIGERRRYTPDFWLYDDDGELELLVDVKGWLYPKSDASIKLFQESHPSLPFELWDQEALTKYGILDLEIPEPPRGRKRKGLRSRISKKEITDAVRLYESGMTLGQVASKLNRSESAISRHLQLLGKTRNRYQTKKMMNADQGTRDLIAQTYLSGLSMTKTASKLGVSRDIVSREIMSRGISRSRAQAQLLKNREVS